MSFILDALRKSEHDRQRQTGPGLAEVPIAAAKPRRNVWAAAAVALLIVNLIAIGVLLWRRASHEPPAAVPAASTAPAAAPSPAPAPAPATAAPAEPSLSAPPAAQASVTQALPQPVLQPSRAAPAPPPGRNPLESEVSGGSQNLEAGMAARAASVPEGPPAVRRTATPTPTATTIGGGSSRYEAIPESTVARAVAAETQAPPPTSAQRSALPNADEVMASGGMPKLHLDLHVYSARPQDRFVFVNSHKYREGDTLQEGPVIEQITPNGAVLDYRGSRFMLSRD